MIISILTTGMFNLIVKDPYRGPPERAVWIGESQPCCGPRTCCAAFLRELFKVIKTQQARQSENRFSFRFSARPRFFERALI
jgi:cell fate regulator YaaT (PSP1 superfamily)